MRLWSYQAVAHGADTVMFFQMRRSIGACEKYHGALIDHAGHENTRVFREMAALGEELDRLKDAVLGGRSHAKAAIVMDWDNWWAAEYSAGPSKMINYYEELLTYYKAFYRLNIPVDFISTEDELTGYGLVVAPMLYMCKEGYDEKVRCFVAEGGRFLTTYFSGYVEDHDLVVTGGYPAKLRDILGIWVEESDALPENEENCFEYRGRKYPAAVMCDLLHPQGAQTLSVYEKDFYAGMPVLTKNVYGKGLAYYTATRSNEEFYVSFIDEICKEAGIVPLMETPEPVEVTMRENEKGSFLFLLNHGEEACEVTLPFGGISLLDEKRYAEGELLMLDRKAVVILKKI